MASGSYARRTPTQERVTDTFVQLQAKVPPEVRVKWKAAARENGVALSLMFEGMVETAEDRGISLGELLAPLLPDHLRLKGEQVTKNT